MGTASSAFQNSDVDSEATTVVKLIQFLFHDLDRQMISALERGLGANEPHKRNIRRLIAQTAEQKPSMTQILKPTSRMSHNSHYSIFTRVCEISSKCQHGNASFMRRLIAIGKSLKLSKDEIYRAISITGLAD